MKLIKLKDQSIRLRRLLFLLSALSVSLTLASCGKGISGEYEGTEGDKLELKSSGKWYVNSAGQTGVSIGREGDFEVDGDKVILKGFAGQQNVTLTRNPDGSLGPFKKVGSSAPASLNLSASANSNSGKVKDDLQQIKASLMMYQAANGFYPSTDQGLKALVQKPDTDPKPRNWRQLEDQVPRDPWNQEYFYRCPGKHNPTEYDIFSAGPDRNPETEEDNIGNWEQAK